MKNTGMQLWIANQEMNTAFKNTEKIQLPSIIIYWQSFMGFPQLRFLMVQNAFLLKKAEIKGQGNGYDSTTA